MRASSRAVLGENGAMPDEVAVGAERGEDLVLVGPASRLTYSLRRISTPLVRCVDI